MSLFSAIEARLQRVLDTTAVERAQVLLKSRSGVVMLAAISFVESALPAPLLTDPFLVAAILANRSRAAVLIFVTTIASVLGGVVAYAMAYFFFSSLASVVGAELLAELHELATSNESGTLVFTLVGAVTPIPYTLASWAIALTQGSLIVFIFGSILGRGFRYALVGYATYRFGLVAVSYARRYLLLSSFFIFVLVGIYIWLKM